MQRIKMLLQKINEIAHKGDKATLIEIDLMMDYTRVLYADMAEIKSKLTFRTEVPDVATNPISVKVEEPIQEIIAQPVQKQALTTTTPVVNIPVPIIKANKAPIEQLIGINDKYQFISELFKNNTELYDTTIKEVGDFDSNQQAIDWLKANFKWDSENDTVQSFLSIINRHYNS